MPPHLGWVTHSTTTMLQIIPQTTLSLSYGQIIGRIGALDRDFHIVVVPDFDSSVNSMMDDMAILYGSGFVAKNVFRSTKSFARAFESGARCIVTSANVKSMDMVREFIAECNNNVHVWVLAGDKLMAQDHVARSIQFANSVTVFDPRPVQGRFNELNWARYVCLEDKIDQVFDHYTTKLSTIHALVPVEKCDPVRASLNTMGFNVIVVDKNQIKVHGKGGLATISTKTVQDAITMIKTLDPSSNVAIVGQPKILADTALTVDSFHINVAVLPNVCDQIVLSILGKSQFAKDKTFIFAGKDVWDFVSSQVFEVATAPTIPMPATLVVSSGSKPRAPRKRITKHDHVAELQRKAIKVFARKQRQMVTLPMTGGGVYECMLKAGAVQFGPSVTVTELDKYAKEGIYYHVVRKNTKLLNKKATIGQRFKMLLGSMSNQPGYKSGGKQVKFNLLLL